MIRLRSFLSKILGIAIQTEASRQTTRNYSRIIITTGIIGLTSIGLWRFKNYNPFHRFIPSPFILPVNSQPRENYNFLVNVTKKCSPSVVAIEVKNSQRISPDTGQPTLTSTGSGFVVKDNGWIMTNAHVIMNKPNAIVNVITTTGQSYEATIEDIDLKLDLALLKIPCNNLPALQFGTSGDVSTGEWVVALGSPLSLKHTITAGVVSSISRDAKDLGFSNNTMKFIQTDAAITFGHSGGPLVNLDGEVIGVNNLRITAGIAFAIPIDYVKEFLLRSRLHSAENARIQKSMNQPKFGITTLALTEDIVQNLMKEQHNKLPDKTAGVLIWNVVKNSLADKAGLKSGDVVTHMNRISITSIADFYSFLSSYEREPIVFTIYRKGNKTEITLKTR